MNIVSERVRLFRADGAPYIRPMSSLDELMVKPGEDARLAERDTARRLHFKNKDAAKAGMAEDAREIDRLQDILYAENKRALLVILQGTDTSGKDGTIRDVFNATGPLGVHVVAFRPPSEEERAHDFLWRCTAPVRRAARSASSTVRTTRTCWWRGCGSSRPPRRSRRATERSTPSKKS